MIFGQNLEIPVILQQQRSCDVRATLECGRTRNFALKTHNGPDQLLLFKNNNNSKTVKNEYIYHAFDNWYFFEKLGYGPSQFLKHSL